MARQESLIQWASNNRNLISLEAREFDWAWSKEKRLFDFEVRLKVDGFRGVGRGSDIKETTALTKALAEALERAVCASLKISTVGVAAHTVSHLARENAQLEALERYAFQQHLKDRVGFTPLSGKSTAIAGPEMQFFRMRLPLPYQAVLCFISDSDEKFIGLSCEMNLASAMDKAALEALRNHTAFMDNPDNFRRAVAEDPNLWCCRRDFVDNVASFMTAPSTAEISLPLLRAEKIETVHLPTLAGCPIVFERVQIIGGEE